MRKTKVMVVSAALLCSALLPAAAQAASWVS
jgi:hypothetical protein